MRLHQESQMSSEHQLFCPLLPSADQPPMIAAPLILSSQLAIRSQVLAHACLSQQLVHCNIDTKLQLITNQI